MRCIGLRVQDTKITSVVTFETTTKKKKQTIREKPSSAENLTRIEAVTAAPGSEHTGLEQNGDRKSKSDFRKRVNDSRQRKSVSSNVMQQQRPPINPPPPLPFARDTQEIV